MILLIKSILQKSSVKTVSRRACALALVLIVCFSFTVPVFASSDDLYYYNGVSLPNINSVWYDKSTYPYSFLLSVGPMTVLILSSSRFIVSNTSSSSDFCPASNGISKWYSLDGDSWSFDWDESLTSGSVLFDAEDLFWCSSDVVISGSGAVYMAASDPVPVNPPDPVVTSVSISTAYQVIKGSSVPVRVTAHGDGAFDPDVTLSLSGNTSNLTYVVPTGVSDNVSTFDLYCGSNETAFTLALTATSVSDPSISSTYNIVVQAASTGTNPGESLNPTVPSDTVPRIDTSFDNTQVYCPLGQTIGLMFSAYGYPNMHLKYYEFGSLKSETDLVFDSTNSVLYGGFYVAPEIQDSYTQVRIDAYSDDVLVSSYFTTVVCADPPSADGSDQVIIDALESVGVSQEEIKESLTTVQSTVDEILSGGDSAGDLTDSGASITDNMTIVEEFENQHKDTIDSGLSGITSDIDYSGLVPALSFLTGYLNIAWSGLGGLALIFTVPMFLGVFFYLCSRTPGSSIIRDSFKPKNNNTDSKKDV